MPKLFRDEGREGMKQSQRRPENSIEHGNVGRDLAGLDVPIAEITPYKVVELFRCLVELVRIEGGRHPRDGARQCPEDILVMSVGWARRWIGSSLHLDEPRGVPELIHEVATNFATLLIEQDVLTLRRNQHKAETQAVRAVLRDQIERVGR